MDGGHGNNTCKLVGRDCNFCAHWTRYHADNPADFSGVEIYFLDQVDDPGAREDGYPHLRRTGGWWTWGAWGHLTQCRGAIRRMMQQPRPGGLRSKWAGGCLCPFGFLKK